MGNTLKKSDINISKEKKKEFVEKAINRLTSKEFMNILSYEITKNFDDNLKELEELEELGLIDNLLHQITENIRPGTIHKLKSLSNDLEFLDYAVVSGKKAYNDMIIDETPYFDRELIYRLIEKIFSKKQENHSSKTINNIIVLMVIHNCINFYEKMFDKNIEKVQKIKKNYEKLEDELDELYEKIVDEFNNIPHQCVNFRFDKYCPDSNCIICGEILIKPENYISYVSPSI